MMLPTTKSNAIRVLIVDDSSVMRAVLARMIESDRDLQIVGYAVDGVDALDQIRTLDPDVVTLDIEMPRLNGLEALGRIMLESPRPVIMLSSLTREGAKSTFEALERGAFDFIAKPGAESSHGVFDIREELVAKIKSAAHSPLTQTGPPPRKAPARVAPNLSAQIQTAPAIIAIGTSTGGPKALQEVLAQLPAQLPTGVLIVQHMPVGFTAQFADRLNSLCKVAVREVKGEESIEAGTVYIAPAGMHMTVARAGTKYHTHLSKTPGGTLHTPSVDVLMHSVARVYGRHAMGVILTGMGADGAQGMKAIRDAGGWTIGQDAESCAVYGMPRSAAELNALCRVAPLSHIAAEILSALTPRASAAAGSASARSAR
jgi:two-component system chemotaxis response regulator CheB